MTANGKTPPSAPAHQKSETPGGRRAPSARFFKAVKRLALVFAVVILLLGGYLYFYASRQQAYINGRNLRALSSMSTQIGTALQSADQLFKLVDTTLIAGVAEWDSASAFVPLYNDMVFRVQDTAKFVGDRTGLCSSIEQASLPRDTMEQSLASWRNDPARLPHCLYRQFTIIRRPAEGQTKTDTALAVINLADYLAPILPRSVFHKTVLADNHGRVLLQAGLSDIALTSLAAIAGPSKGDSSAVAWEDLRAKPSITDVHFAGKTYRLFLEPCCLSSEGLYSDRHLVVAGLVSKDALVRESLKISLSLVMICSAILFLAFLGWPFLKLRLIGEREPVQLRDGLLISTGSLLAVAMSTIFALDLYSYTKFRSNRDEELRALSVEILRNLNREVTRAYRELSSQAPAALARAEAKPPSDSLQRIAKDTLDFPFFESWSILNAKGKQVLKWSTDSYIQRRIPVKDRAYFSEVARGLGWPGPPPVRDSLAVRVASGSAYYLEPTVSRTTGKRQVALSIQLADPGTPVAAMALEMVSLIGVVLPPGYGFSVLDSAGKVLLHSDPSRNLDERFFSETDQNRELISAIVARSADTLNLKYGGSDYRAYVTPVPDLPWSLVTFLDKQPGRINNAEWLGTSAYLTLVYAFLLGIFVALTLLFFPGYRAPWIWPDRRLRSGYLRLVIINSLYLLALLLAVVWLEGDDLLVAAFVLPLQAVIAAWACLVRHRHLADWLRATILACPVGNPHVAAWLSTVAQACLLKPREVDEWMDTAVRAVVALALFSVLVPALLLSGAVGWAHWLIILLAVAGSGLALRPRPWFGPFTPEEEAKSPRSIERAYIGAAVLFLLVTGVLPAAAFFKSARSAHTEMLIKGGQLRLARAMEERENRIAQIYNDKLGAGKSGAKPTRLCQRDTELAKPDLCELDLYYRFYFGTQLHTAPATGQDRSIASSDLVRWFLVPYRPQSSVEWRGMLPQSAYDSTWSWVAQKNRLEFHASRKAGARPILSSAVPGFWPEGSSERLAALLLGAAVLILTTGIARFLARRFFLIDVIDPVLVSRERRIGTIAGTNLLVVCRDGFEQRKIVPYQKSQVVDLTKDKFQQRDERRSLLKRVGQSEPVVVRHFEYRHDNGDTTKAKLSLLDALVSESGSSLVVVAEPGSDGAPLGLQEAWRLAAPLGSKPQPSPGERSDGFVNLLESFVQVDVGRWEQGWKEGERRSEAISSTSGSALSLIQAESYGDAHLDRTWKGLVESLRRTPPGRAEPSREELLDLLGERAEPYYRGIWESCQTGERVVLVHLAQHGLVNDKDRRILRRLLARGLIRRRPHFTVMNETFRRYLLSRSAEVQTDVPSGADSPWDSVRRPVLAIVASLTILLFVTQQELFSATNAIVTALATGIASFSRISGLFDSRRGTGSGTS